MKQQVFFAIIVLVFMISLGSASFEVDENSSYVQTSYLQGDFVRGILNMSFSNEKNSDFTSGFEGGISLIDLLNESNYVADIDFTCVPSSCETDYDVLPGTLGDTQVLNLDNKILYGFQITDTTLLERVKSNGFKFFIDVDENSPGAGATCENQLYIDLFDDGTIDFYNTNPKLDGVCVDRVSWPNHGKNFGCFDENEVTGDDAIIGNDKFYCEVLQDLPPAPAYKVGAIVEKTGAGENLQFNLFPYPTAGSGYLDCGEAPCSENIDNPDGGEISTIIGYSSIEEADFIACLWANQGEGDYTIRVSEHDESCGGSSNPGAPPTRFDTDYEIFAQPMPYGVLNDFEFNDDLYEAITGRDLIDDINDYLNFTYGFNCSEGCIIPFSIYGKENVEAKLESALLQYVTVDHTKATDDLYQLVEEQPAVSSSYLIFDIEDMEFLVPDEDGDHDFDLELDRSEVISEEINVDIGRLLIPRSASEGEM